MKAKPAGVHAIVGDKAFDSWLAEEALEQILARAVGPERAHAVQVLRGDETSWVRLLDAARTRSLFSERRAIVVRGADALKGEAEGLDAFLADPTPGVTLVLIAAKPDRRRSVWKRVLEAADVVRAEPPKGQRLRAFVQEQVHRRKLTASEEAVEELIERVGQDLRRLVGELEKLEAFAHGLGRPLSAEDVAAVLGRGLAQPLYKLGDAFAARRVAEVLGLLEESLGEGEAPLRIAATLYRVLRQLRGVRALREARVPREQMAGRLQVPPFKMGDLLAAERRWTEAELARALEALARADRRVKTGGEGRVALEAAVVEACGGEVEVRPSPPTGR